MGRSINGFFDKAFESLANKGDKMKAARTKKEVIE